VLGLEKTLGPGRIVGGRYRLVDKLARGGMGHVWEARHLELEVPVAVKFMAPSLVAQPEARERFKREAKAAASLRSPHVVQILDFGVDEGAPYIVMELLEGEDLSTRLARVGRLDLAAASKILTEACKALELAGRAGIVHCDLKPANLFLTTTGNDEVVKVLDFGVARMTAGNAAGGPPDEAGFVGSPHYMSPEQARGGADVGPAADLWSMGVIVYRMVVGERPFEADDVGDLLLRVCEMPIPKATRRALDLPASVDAFFERALARDPARRFASPEAMAWAFAAIASAEAPAPVPPRASADAPPPAFDNGITLSTTRPPSTAKPPALGGRGWTLAAGAGAVGVVIAVGGYALRGERAQPARAAPAAAEVEASAEAAAAPARAPLAAPSSVVEAEPGLPDVVRADRSSRSVAARRVAPSVPPAALASSAPAATSRPTSGEDRHEVLGY
jgi:serine/threonine-protein kinase